MSSHRAEFYLAAPSGIIAGTISANSVLFAWRNPPTLANGDTNMKGQKLTLVSVQYRTLTGFPTAQEVALGIYGVSAFGTPPIDYSGGTDLSDQTSTANAVHTAGPDPGPKPAQVSVLQTGNVRIASTSALTNANSPTIATFPFAYGSEWELAASSSVQQGAFDLVWTPSLEGSKKQKGRVILPGKGFVIRNPIALGATGTCRLFVEVFWEES